MWCLTWGRENLKKVMLKNKHKQGHLLFIHKRMWLKRIFLFFPIDYNTLTIPFHLISIITFFRYLSIINILRRVTEFNLQKPVKFYIKHSKRHTRVLNGNSCVNLT